jgi:SAM-dependent methyltransferase
MVHTPTAPSRSYVLGHADQELERLVRQSAYFEELTAALLRQAGLEPGMRVLDVGCGAGDVSLLAAGIVGPEGSVLGIDTSPRAVEFASWRAAEAGLTNVRFQVRDAVDLELDEPVDAVTGRLILMYFADPVVALRRLLSVVRPGGIVVFQEIDMQGATSAPTCPTFETAIQRIRQAFVRAGCGDRAGLRLPQMFRAAGLPAPRLVAGARVETGPDAEAYDLVTEITRTLQPVMMATGVATAEEIGIDTLSERLRDETIRLNATLVAPTLIGAWSRQQPGNAGIA